MVDSPFRMPAMVCPCGKTSDFCDNGLCYTWASKLWRRLRRLLLRELERQ